MDSARQLPLVMPIPRFNENGVLPEGVHDCTWAELFDRFCGFQATDRRPELCRQLREMVAALRRAGLAGELLINGSFVTAKASPNDIDLILVLPADWDFAADLSPGIYNLVSKKRVRKRFGFDILVACRNTPEYGHYLELFQRVRYEPHGRKGILRLRYD